MFLKIKRVARLGYRHRTVSIKNDRALSFPDMELPHSARVSLMSLLIVVLTEVPRESVIWNVIL